MPKRLTYPFISMIFIALNILILSVLGFFLIWALEYIHFTEPISAIFSRETPFLFNDTEGEGGYLYGKSTIQSWLYISTFLALIFMIISIIPLKNTLLFHKNTPRNKYQKNLLNNFFKKVKGCLFWYSAVFLSVVLFTFSYTFIGPDLNINKEIIKEYSKETLSAEYESVYFKIFSGRMDDLKNEYKDRKQYFFLGINSNLEHDKTGRSLYFNEKDIKYSEVFWAQNGVKEERNYYQKIKSLNEKDAEFIHSGAIDTDLNKSLNEFGYFSLKYKNTSSAEEVCVKVFLESLSKKSISSGDTACSKGRGIEERLLISSFPIQHTDTFNIKIKVWGSTDEIVRFSSTKFIVTNMPNYKNHATFCLHYSDPAYPNLFFRAVRADPNTFDPKYIEERPCPRLLEVK